MTSEEKSSVETAHARMIQHLLLEYAVMPFKMRVRTDFLNSSVHLAIAATFRVIVSHPSSVNDALVSKSGTQQEIKTRFLGNTSGHYRHQ